MGPGCWTRSGRPSRRWQGRSRSLPHASNRYRCDVPKGDPTRRYSKELESWPLRLSAAPRAFQSSCGLPGLEVVETRWFADHHPFVGEEIDEVVKRAAELDAMVVTTAKDAVKMPRDLAVSVVEASMVPLSGSWDELWRLLPGIDP